MSSDFWVQAALLAVALVWMIALHAPEWALVLAVLMWALMPVETGRRR